MSKTAFELIYVLRCAINETKLDLKKVTSISGLIKLASVHSLIPYIYKTLLEAGVDEINSFSGYIEQGEIRASLQSHYREAISKELSKANIPHVFLKGKDIEKFMPLGISRFSCDVDFYYPKEHRKSVSKAMLDLGFREEAKETIHDSFFIKPFVNVEAHFLADFYEKDFCSDFSKFEKKDGTLYQMSDEDVYIYNILHTARHFKGSGIGLRALVDCFLIKRCVKNLDYIEKTLSQIGLNEFEKQFYKLSKLCFEGEGQELSGLYLDMFNYICKSATYGSDYNKNLVKTDSENIDLAKKKQFRRRLFPPLKEMKIAYPVLKPLPFLLPFLWVYRLIVALLFKRKKVKGEIKSIKSFSKEEIAKNKEMFKNLCI